MQFKQVKKEVKAVNFESVRADNEDYFEAVIVKDNLKDLTAKLEDLFGKPAWPSQTKIPDYVEKVIAGFGGIMKGQTLYFLVDESFYLFAMLWPWQDGLHITLKTGQK